MATYELEFGHLGDSRPVPNLTVRTTDPNVLSRTVVEHARPYITPVLTEMGRPELADCLFQLNPDRTKGGFLWLDLVGAKAASFLAARITTTPERIQRKRTAGWTANGAKYVGRGSRFGNPFTVDIYVKAGRIGYRDRAEGRRLAAADFRQWLVDDDHGLWCGPRSESDKARAELWAAIPELRGRDLMCWCPLDGPCHADVLLKLANSSAATPAP